MSPSTPKNKKWLANLLLTVAVLLAALAAFIATRPADFRVTRAALMAAPPSAAFAQVNNFQNWAAWDPWGKMDPQAKVTFEGPKEGIGAIYRWDGDQVGAGSSTIVESKADELVRLRLEFLKPFAATNTVDFTFQPQGDQTLVSWSMHGKNNFMAKAFSLVMDCEKMCGPEFEKGLASMKAIVEASSKLNLAETTAAIR